MGNNTLLCILILFWIYLFSDACTKYTSVYERRPELISQQDEKPRVDDRELRSSVNSDMSIDNDADQAQAQAQAQTEAQEQPKTSTWQPPKTFTTLRRSTNNDNNVILNQKMKQKTTTTTTTQSIIKNNRTSLLRRCCRRLQHRLRRDGGSVYKTGSTCLKRSKKRIPPENRLSFGECLLMFFEDGVEVVT
jgi:hypothetical protein